jgi:hypothetical protein
VSGHKETYMILDKILNNKGKDRIRVIDVASQKVWHMTLETQVVKIDLETLKNK